MLAHGDLWRRKKKTPPITLTDLVPVTLAVDLSRGRCSWSRR